MKKLILSFIVMIMAFSYANSQNSISLSWDGEAIGDTVTVWGDPSDEFAILMFYAVATNNTDAEIVVGVSRNEISIVEGSENNFCWGGQCYPNTTDVSTTNDTIAPGESSPAYDFSGDYSPKQQVGTSIIEYTFFNVRNPDENVKVVVKFWASPEGISEDAMQGGQISDIYPNPANNYVNLDYNLTPAVKQAKVRVVNILGSVVKEAEIEKGTSQLRLDVSDLENGVYFYSVLINGDTYKTKKLVIR